MTVTDASSMTLETVMPRFNADTFRDGLLAVFHLALGIDFGESLSLRLHAYASSTPFYIIVPILYFSLIIIVGNWVLFNCFVSTMIVSFRRETTVLCQKPQRTQIAGQEKHRRKDP